VVPGDDTAIMEESTSHIGLSVSGKSHANLWPNVAEWFAERSVLDESAVDVEIDESDVAADDTSSDADSADLDDRDLDQIPGIGPAYADRLREAGVATVSGLAAAEPETLADCIDVPASRVADWVDHATELTS
jgi:polyhydroxyalkanoate synthase